MIINHNLMAMNTHRQLGINQTNSSKSMERLSSGMRINRAGDDAAGLAISEKMRGQIRGLKQAARNAQDGISLIQTAEGALNETHAILQRMRELATQASTDTNTLTDRKEIQKEINQLLTEIDRISSDTEFNTQGLLDGSYSGKIFHIGANADQKMDVSISNMGTTAIGTAGRTGAAGGGTTPAQAATATVNGVTFTATETGEDFNDYEISFQDGTTEGVAVDRDSKTIVVTLDFSNTPTTDASSWTVNATGTGTGSFTVSGTLTGDVSSTGTTAGGAEEVAGGGTTPAQAATATVDGVTFTATETGEDFNDYEISFQDGTTEGVAVDRESKTIVVTLNFSGTPTTDASLWAVNATGTGTGSFTVSGTFTGDVNSTGTTADGAEEVAGGGTTPAQAATATVNGVTFTATETGEDFNDYEISFQDGTTEGVAVDRDSKTIVVTLDFSNTPTTDASSWTVNATGTGTGSFTVSGTLTGDVSATGTTAGGAEEVAGGGTATNIDALAVDDADIDSLAATLTDAEVEAALQAAGSGVGVLTQAGANAAITNINDAIEQVSAERSKLGAIQNRLEHTIANLGTSAENLQAAEARIRDLDMAEEMMAFTKNNILQQAATAMLAQANMAPQSVLQLLG